VVIKVSDVELRQLYCGQNLSLRQIALLKGVDKRTVGDHLRKAGILLRPRPNGVIEPDIRISPRLSYILGVVFGDGFVQLRCQYGRTRGFIYLKAYGYSFHKSFADALRDIGLRPRIRECKKPLPVSPSRQEEVFYQTSAMSIRFAHFLKDLKANPHKLRYYVLPYPLDFLRGIYESDGNLRTGKAAYIGFTNTDRSLVDLIMECLSALNLPHHFYSHQPSNNRLRYYRVIIRKRDIQHFLEIIRPSIKNEY